MYYSDDVINEVLSRNDIVDVIGSYASLKKKGANYEACCPFHHEKTPSFKVNREKQMYHCFGCGVGGNVFTFVMEYENLNFPEAVERLAERAGVQLPEKSMNAQERSREQYKITLREMNKTAAAYFHYILKHSQHGEKAYEYFHETRGLSDETINKFALGYSDIYRDDLYRYLKSKGYTDDQMKGSGLVEISEKEGGVDKFWNRAMIPILDINGKVIAFGGRVMGDGKPKYINTSDTAVFDKSHTLFAMNIARRSRRKGFICCEGYMDVISMHQAGFNNAVASLGTALTSQQASLLKRYTDEVLIIYDSDEAGVKAALRAIPMLKTAGLSTKVINLRPYKDPDEFIKNMGKEAFQERLDHGMNSFMFELKALEGQYDMEDPQGRTDFFKETAKRLLRFEDEIERSSYIKTIAGTYQVEPEELRKMVNRLAMKGVGMTETVKPKSGLNRNKEKQNGYEVSQKLMLTWLTSYPEIFGEVSRYIGPDDFTRPLYHQVAELLYEQYRQGEPNPARLLNQFTDSEEQTEVAAVFNATIPLDSEQEREQALLDVICRMKEDSIAHRTENLAPTDMQGLMNLMQAKKELEELKAGKLHLHISFC